MTMAPEACATFSVTITLSMSQIEKAYIYIAIYICGHRRGNIILNIFFQIAEISLSHSALSLDTHVDLYWSPT